MSTHATLAIPTSGQGKHVLHNAPYSYVKLKAQTTLENQRIRYAQFET